MTSQRIRALALASLSLFLLFLLLARSFMPGLSAGRSSQDLGLIESIIRLVRNDYLERVDPDKTMEGAFRGLVQGLDPLSSYLNRSELAAYREAGSVPLYDAGIVLIKEPGGMPRVIDVEKGRPAAKSGVKIGDFLSAIDGQPTFGLSLTELRLLLRSRENRPAVLRVVRQTSTVEITVERTLRPAADCSYAPETSTAGVLTVRRMSPALAGQAANALPVGVKSSSAPLVLDLRTCWEGDADSARAFINLFLKAERAGVFLSRDGSRKALSCPGDPEWGKTPLVVWTGTGTHGAAEIAAGVLKFFKRASVVGHRTPGLAAEQTLFPLDDGSALLLTTGIFVLPSGVKLWEEGVVPDIDLGPPQAERSLYLKKTLETAAGR
ncbi:MAG: PDZ domain-containing protein [Candidatus Aminicenantes bacterium]|nr:PDZ domain-containing protein [Candidatus Aminicenantes bacterium]